MNSRVTSKAENYVEGENYIYRRVRDSETDMLLRFDLEKGEAKFAEIKSQSDPQALSTTSTSDDPLKTDPLNDSGICYCIYTIIK